MFTVLLVNHQKETKREGHLDTYWGKNRDTIADLDHMADKVFWVKKFSDILIGF